MKRRNKHLLLDESQPVLSLSGVTKRFGGIVASDDVNMHVNSGEIVGLIGPNGAGKTTILNQISGIYSVDAGRIYFGGNDITTMPAHERAHLGIARTFQTPRFLNRSTIRDNMMLAADLASHIGYWKSFCSKSDTGFIQRVEELVKIAGIKFSWDDDIASLPYGNRKLLEIIRALLTEPKVMLVDEPAAGLNSSEIDQAVGLLKYGTQRGIGVVLIEHSMDLVMNHCDRIVVLNFGCVIATGSPKEISTNPRVIEAYLGRRNHA